VPTAMRKVFRTTCTGDQTPGHAGGSNARPKIAIATPCGAFFRPRDALGASRSRVSHRARDAAAHRERRVSVPRSTLPTRDRRAARERDTHAIAELTTDVRPTRARPSPTIGRCAVAVRVVAGDIERVRSSRRRDRPRRKFLLRSPDTRVICMARCHTDLILVTDTPYEGRVHLQLAP
jgi:hypothetical protein